MGAGYCTLCTDLNRLDRPKTSEDYTLIFHDESQWIVCGLWEHYAGDHSVLPPPELRALVMRTNPDNVEVTRKVWRGYSSGRRNTAYFVEISEDGVCNHDIGRRRDGRFIKKMKILESKATI